MPDDLSGGGGTPRKQPPQMIRPPNRMKDKVTLGGRIKDGGYDSALVAAAEAATAASVAAFNHDLDEAVERMVAAVEMMAGEPTQRQSFLKDLLDAVGSAASAAKDSEYDLLTAFSVSLLAFLERRKVIDDTGLQVIRAHVDSMRLIYVRELHGDGGEVGRQLANALRDTIARVLGKA